MPSAWPGTMKTGALMVRPSYVSSTIWSFLSPSLSAIVKPTMAALSQTSLVIGLGNSWSQPLLANRPSQIVGSGRNRTLQLPGTTAGRGPKSATPWP